MVFVLDRCNIQEEPLSDVPFTFSISKVLLVIALVLGDSWTCQYP